MNAVPQDPEPARALERWRMILGAPASHYSELGAEDRQRDAAMQWLYGRDEELAQRGVRKGGALGGGRGGDRSGDSADRHGGAGDSFLTTVDWLEGITKLFPKETVERLTRDAVDRYQIHDLVTDPRVLERVEPSPALLKAVLRTKHLMDPKVLELARKLVAAVVEELMRRLATEVRHAFSGTRLRRPSQVRLARNFDVKRTLRGNLGHYQPEERKLYLEHAHFFTRTRRRVDSWQVILLVDQSGSMLSSVIHSAVTAACLWGLPGVRTHLVAFDTSVVDLTQDVADPVDLLMKVQLGGGTDIAQAIRYAADLVENPRRSIVVLISDLYEGVSPAGMVRGVKALVEQGSRVLALCALDEEAAPAYDREMGQRLADLGAYVGAMTPGELAAFVAEAVNG
ncbi:VWA domain-containing protein [Catenulispora yoronensis]|uniref:VWA domain-containing protein n=2 Tax=Catenulispora yoronensis TaxID=450799 RepID=A0ABN2VBW0_9ACTN